jgi:hypothetical protein
VPRYEVTVVLVKEYVVTLDAQDRAAAERAVDANWELVFKHDAREVPTASAPNGGLLRIRGKLVGL